MIFSSITQVQLIFTINSFICFDKTLSQKQVSSVLINMENEIKNLDEYRSMLFSIAYNMLGTVADAEDMVQETYVSWLNSDKSHVENTRFYLIRTISNKCLTHLKKLKKEREVYKGTWLPEPILSAANNENNAELTDNLSLGFLYLLEKLTPIERGVIILKEAFNIDYPEISKIFDLSNDNCRQNFSRAKKKLALEKTKFEVQTSVHEKILRQFLDACLSQNLEGLIELLREDVVVYGDGNGNGKTILNPVFGKQKVLRLLISGMEKNAPTFAKTEILTVNGLSGAAFYLSVDQKIPLLLIAIDTDGNSKIQNIYFLSNPQKLNFKNR